MFIAPGNHDFYSPKSPYVRLQMPENVHIFTENAMRGFVLPGLNARVYGAAFTENRSGPLLRGFHAQRREGGVNLLCLHGDVGAKDSPYNPITEEELRQSGIDYAALGHIHKASGLRQAGQTWYSWPGCPEGRGFDETGDKGAYLGTLEDDGRLTLDFIPLAWRRYLVPELDITGRDPDRALDDLMAQAHPQDILRIVLTGERDEDNEPDLTALTARASGYFYSASVVDRTVLGRSLWARMEEDTLTGLFLRNMRQRLDHAAPEDKEILERAIRFGLAALEGREEPK